MSLISVFILSSIFAHAKQEQFYSTLSYEESCSLNKMETRILYVLQPFQEYYHFYFIPSSELNAYLKQINVVLSAVKKYFCTSDEYDLYFFTVANRSS